LQEAAERTLAYYERPKDVVVVADLPLTAVGKVSRQALATRFADHFGSR
jgi:non-ribosomal peptide synthetase component E (peptide arylation enzyme)